MKRFFSSLSFWAVATTLWSTGSVSQAAVADYEGSYEALLSSGSDLSAMPAAKLGIKLTKAGTFTGTLTSSDAKSYSLTGKIEEVDGVALLLPPKGSTLRELSVKRGAALPNYAVSFSIDDGIMSATLTTAGLSASANDGVKLRVFPKGEAADWAGSYTLALSEPEKLPSASADAYPTGSGYASVTVDAKGVLKYKGKLADGTLLNGSLAADSSRAYRLFVNPYKTAGSFLSGSFSFGAIEGAPGKFGLSEETEFFWKKAPAPKPNAYISGFGPLGVSVSLAPWVRPNAGATLIDALATTGKQIPFSLSGAGIVFGEDYRGQTPSALEIGPKNELLPVFGDVFAPSTAAGWAKVWNVKINPLTGVYSGSLILRDLVVTPPSIGKDGRTIYTPVKFVNRKLVIEGVLLRDLLNAAAPFSAEGFFQLPPINAKVETAVAGGAMARGALEERGTGAPEAGAISPGTAGTYTTNVKLSASSVSIPGGLPGVTVTGTMKGLPATNTTVTFSIAPDLSHIVFAGRKVPLVGDSRPVALVFSDASSKNFKNTLTLNVYLNTNSGVVTGVAANYIQLLSARYSLAGFNVNAFFPGTATYAENSTPVKIK